MTPTQATTPTQAPSDDIDIGQATPVPTVGPAPGDAADWWRPTPGNSWQIQYTGTIDTTLQGITIYNLDLFDTSENTIASIHNNGGKVICYFSAGTYENWRPDADQFPAAVLAGDNGWPGERWLDIRAVSVLEPLMTARIQLAASKGCDAVDPDNVDGYSNNTGVAISANQQKTYNTNLAEMAHRAGLAIGLKNDLEQVSSLVSSFDFAVNEQCFQYNECELLVPFITQNKPVFNIEYNRNTAQFCAEANSLNFDSLRKNLSLDGYREACR